MAFCGCAEHRESAAIREQTVQRIAQTMTAHAKGLESSEMLCHVTSHACIIVFLLRSAQGLVSATTGSRSILEVSIVAASEFAAAVINEASNSPHNLSLLLCGGVGIGLLLDRDMTTTLT